MTYDSQSLKLVQKPQIAYCFPFEWKKTFVKDEPREIENVALLAVMVGGRGQSGIVCSVEWIGDGPKREDHCECEIRLTELNKTVL